MFDFIKKFGERRAAPRTTIQRQVRFVSREGVSCTGSSKNIGAESLLLVSEQRNAVNEQEEGELIVDYRGQTHTFPARIIRNGKYSMDRYCLAVQFLTPEAVAFFAPMIVTGSSCLNCGGMDNLERCPNCNGIETVCATCLERDRMCRSCRSDNYLQQQRNR
jgi:hypothetical protein